MDKLKKVISINLKSNTKLLVDYLEAVVGDEMILNSFIRSIEIIKENQKEVYIATNTKEAYDVIKENYLPLFIDGVKNVYQKKMKIHFVVDKQINESNEQISSKTISSKFTFSNYVECQFNNEAIKMAKKTIESPGRFSPLFITSNSGLGKTHLLHAVGNSLLKNNYLVYYIEPNLFTKKIIELSKKGGDSISKYIEEILGYDFLLFDDIQNLGDRSITLKVFLQIINVFIEKDKQIIIASDKSPNELYGFESRFITRFNSGLTTKINTPSTDDLIKILEFKLKKEDLSPEKWEREAIKFIVRNNSTSIRSIEGAVKRVSFYTEDVETVKYTYTVVSNIFKDLTIDPIELTPQRIIVVVAQYYKLNKADVVGKSRKANVVIARHMAIWMIRKILNLSYKKIGRLFSNRDHSTIISSIKTIDKKIAINNIIKVAAERIKKNIKSIT